MLEIGRLLGAQRECPQNVPQHHALPLGTHAVARLRFRVPVILGRWAVRYRADSQLSLYALKYRPVITAQTDTELAIIGLAVVDIFLVNRETSFAIDEAREPMTESGIYAVA